MRNPRWFCFAVCRAFFWCLALASSASVFALAPTNDACQGALVVPGNGPFPYFTTLITNIYDGVTNGDPRPSCITAQVPLFGGLWYAFTPSTSGVYHLSVSEDTETTVPDTVMAIYRSAAGCAGPLIEVGCDDDAGAHTSAVALSLAAQTNYYIVVWAAYDAPNTSKAAVQLRVALPTVPVNDNCAGAELIPPNGLFPHLTQIVDTALATNEASLPMPSCATFFARTVWYRFVPSVTRTLVISTCDDTKTTVYDTLVAVYTNASGCGGTFTRVACNNNNNASNPRSVLTNTFNAGITYYIVAGDASGEELIPGETLIQLRIFDPQPPQVNLASSITPTSAVLNATVPNFNTAHITAWFEWGTSLNYGNVTPIKSLITGTNTFATSNLISGLTLATNHYRLVLSNCFGLARSADQAFFWSSNRPTLTPFHDASGFRLLFNGNPGQQYTVLDSTTLSGWQETGKATELGNGAFEYRDTNFPATRGRFFEIRSP